jgi:hypothetical protein
VNIDNDFPEDIFLFAGSLDMVYCVSSVLLAAAVALDLGLGVVRTFLRGRRHHCLRPPKMPILI